MLNDANVLLKEHVNNMGTASKEFSRYDPEKSTFKA